METIAETQSRLLKQRRQIIALFVLHIALYAAAIGLLFFSTPAGMCTGIANIGFYLLVLRPRMKHYETGIAGACVLHGICAPMQKAAFLGHGAVTPEEFTGLRILPLHKDKKALLSRNAFTAEYGGLRLKVSELTLHYPAAVGGRKSYKFLSGTLLVSRHEANHAEGDWLLLHSDLLEPSAQAGFLSDSGYSSADLSVKNFPLSLWRRGEEAELPAETVRRLQKLEKACPNLAAVRLEPDGAAVFLKGRFYTGHYRPNVTPDTALLEQNTLPERDEVLAFLRFWARPGK